MSDELDKLVKGLDEAGVTIDQVGKVMKQFDKLAEEVGGHDKALDLLRLSTAERDRREIEARGYPEGVDYEALILGEDEDDG